MTVRFRLRELLEGLGEDAPSLYRIAKNAGLSYPTVHGIYHGRTGAISLEVMDGLCRALGCEPGDLFQRDKTRGGRR